MSSSTGRPSVDVFCDCDSRIDEFLYYLPAEVVLHNKHEDCWFSCLGGVYDLSAYVMHNALSPIGKYLFAHAGKDVSHWFDARGRHREGGARLRRYVDAITGEHKILLPYTVPIPEGTRSKLVPVSLGCCLCSCCCASRDDIDFSPETKLTGKCWSELEFIFNSEAHQKGWLTKKPRPCRITNVLTGQQAIISVCEEDNIERIQERALIVNRHGASYTWKYEGKLLDMCLTLTENGILDERDRYLACGLPDDHTTYIPNLLCYYNDDLTEL